MERGDLGFIRTKEGISHYVKVVSKTKKKVEFEVLNGGYSLYLDIVEPPKHAVHDCESAIDWYTEKLESQK